MEDKKMTLKEEEKKEEKMTLIKKIALINIIIAALAVGIKGIFVKVIAKNIYYLAFVKVFTMGEGEEIMEKAIGVSSEMIYTLIIMDKGIKYIIILLTVTIIGLIYEEIKEKRGGLEEGEEKEKIEEK